MWYPGSGVVLDCIMSQSLQYFFQLPHIPHLYSFSQLIRFARVCSNVDNFNNRNLFLTAKLLNKVIDIIKFENHFLNSTTDTPS